MHTDFLYGICATLVSYLKGNQSEAIIAFECVIFELVARCQSGLGRLVSQRYFQVVCVYAENLLVVVEDE